MSIMAPENINIPEEQIGQNSHFIRVPLCLQENEYTCGVACVQSILRCYGIEYRQDELSKVLQTKPVVGTDYRNILRFMRQLDFQATLVEDMSISNLKFFINKGITPLLMIQAWAEDTGSDYTSDWKDAHYVIACGYSDDRIYFMDPWTCGNYTYLPASELLKRWHVKDTSNCYYFGGGLIIKKDHCQFEYDPCIMKYLG